MVFVIPCPCFGYPLIEKQSVPQIPVYLSPLSKTYTDDFCPSPRANQEDTTRKNWLSPPGRIVRRDKFRWSSRAVYLLCLPSLFPQKITSFFISSSSLVSVQILAQTILLFYPTEIPLWCHIVPSLIEKEDDLLGR